MGGTPARRLGQPVLLVEDDAEVREALGAALMSEGYDVTCAHDGREALRFLWRGYRPSAILLDLMLPSVDGFAFREFQRRNGWGDIPVIVVSALDDAPEDLHALKPVRWLKKPIDPDVLLHTLARFCGPAA